MNPVRINLFRLLVVVILTGLVGCATQALDEKPDEKPQVIEKRSDLLRWYDETRKVYYDVKGPVKQIIQLPMQRRTDGEIQRLGDVVWEYWFNQSGRLMSKMSRSEKEPLVIRYSYDNSDRIRQIESLINGSLWRDTQFLYSRVEGEFQENRQDKKSGSRDQVRHRRVKKGNNWLHLSMPVAAVDIMTGKEFTWENELKWSNKGGINNGLGQRYSIKTRDVITSSDITSENGQVNVSGGYRYEHNGNGRLESVTSLSANDRGVYHTTRYKYDGNGLLLSENKRVIGKSLFNDAVDEAIEYDYFSVDQYGNWLERTFTHTIGVDSERERTVTYSQQRKILYYDSN